MHIIENTLYLFLTFDHFLIIGTHQCKKLSHLYPSISCVKESSLKFHRSTETKSKIADQEKAYANMYLALYYRHVCANMYLALYYRHLDCFYFFPIVNNT